MANEKDKFMLLLKTVHNNEDAEYTFVDNDKMEIKVFYDTDYESDNGLDDDDPGYEEFQCIVFRAQGTDNLLDISYHNLPVHVFLGGKTVF